MKQVKTCVSCKKPIPNYAVAAFNYRAKELGKCKQCFEADDYYYIVVSPTYRYMT